MNVSVNETASPLEQNTVNYNIRFFQTYSDIELKCSETSSVMTACCENYLSLGETSIPSGQTRAVNIVRWLVFCILNNW